MNNSSHLITLICGLVAGYFFISWYFTQTITCTHKSTKSQCECTKRILQEKVPFADKARIVLSGASAEEINSYINSLDILSCVFR